MNMRQTMAAAFASMRTALDNCIKSGNLEWQDRWRVRIASLVELIPRGSGIDRGPRDYADLEIRSDAIWFDIGYHHMNDVGSYNGWTKHTINVRPAFDGIEVHVSGRDRDDVKEYLHQVMHHAFTSYVEWDEPAQRWMERSTTAPRRDDPPTHEQDASQSSTRDMFPSDCPDRD